MKAVKKTARTIRVRPVHTPLMLDDRDELDRLRARIEQHAAIVEYVLSTRGEEDALEDASLAALEVGLIEFCASIVTDAGAIRTLLNAAAKRADGAR
jgi:hypothetical protein